MYDSATGTRHLRAMSVTELIDATVTLYRENFALFAGVVAVLAIPQTILGMIYVALLPGTTTSTATGPIGTYDTATQAYTSAAAHSGGTGLLGVIFTIFITGALAQAVAARYLGDPETILGAYTSTGAQPFVRLFLALLLAIAAIVVLVIAIAVLIFLAVAAGSSVAPAAIILAILAGFGGLFVAVYVVPHLYLVPQIIVLERRGVFASVRRSWFLVHGYFWHVVGLVFLVSLMVGIVSGIIAGVVAVVTAGNLVLETGLSGIIGLLLQPISLGATTLLYFDQRVRKEAFDLEYEAARVALSPQ